LILRAKLNSPVYDKWSRKMKDPHSPTTTSIPIKKLLLMLAHFDYILS